MVAPSLDLQLTLSDAVDPPTAWLAASSRPLARSRRQQGPAEAAEFSAPRLRRLRASGAIPRRKGIPAILLSVEHPTPAPTPPVWWGAAVLSVGEVSLIADRGLWRGHLKPLGRHSCGRAAPSSVSGRTSHR